MKPFASMNARGPKKRAFPWLWTAALFGIAILLFTVGFLQYRWNNQIKQATEVRMGIDLESVMMKWHLDLYGEFSAICVALQVGPDSGARDDWNDYLQRYEEWTRAANNSESVENIYANRDLVRDIYIWETSRPEQPRLLRLDADSSKIQASSAPVDLRPLLRHLEQNSANLREALHAWQTAEPSSEGRSESKGELSPSSEDAFSTRRFRRQASWVTSRSELAHFELRRMLGLPRLLKGSRPCVESSHFRLTSATLNRRSHPNQIASQTSLTAIPAVTSTTSRTARLYCEGPHGHLQELVELGLAKPMR
jgi:hypothetical protein